MSSHPSMANTALRCGEPLPAACSELIAEYDQPAIPMLPLLQLCAAAQSMTSMESRCSRSPRICQRPCEAPVPRTSTTSWVYPLCTSLRLMPKTSRAPPDSGGRGRRWVAWSIASSRARLYGLMVTTVGNGVCTGSPDIFTGRTRVARNRTPSDMVSSSERSIVTLGNAGRPSTCSRHQRALAPPVGSPNGRVGAECGTALIRGSVFSNGLIW